MKIKINKLYRLINEIGLFETISLLYLKMFNKKKYDLKILEKIKNENLKILKYYSEQENKISDVIQNTDYIWFFWWQGEESMPSIIKKCLEKVVVYIHLWNNSVFSSSVRPLSLKSDISNHPPAWASSP